MGNTWTKDSLHFGDAIRIGAAICICEEDSVYVDGLLSELERMRVDVAWLANNCKLETVDKLRAFPRTVSVTNFSGSFHNCLRNYPFEALENGYDWIIQWDADEIWEPKAPRKLRNILKNQQMIQVRMAHVWEQNGEKFITLDMGDEKDRIYNTQYKWRYLQRVVAGPTNFDEDLRPSKADIWIIHDGYSTPEKRQFHKERWNRLHGQSVGRNPYGHWNRITDHDFRPTLIPYDEFVSKL